MVQKKALIKVLCASVLCVLSLFAFSGCSKEQGGVKTKEKKSFKIGILQLVEHDALDASYKGFVDSLAEAGYVDGTNISIDYQNAQGEQANCQTIAQKFVNDRCDLILAIATPAAQAAANLTDTIPILVTAVTDPESAKLVKSNAMPGTNVSGTSDLTPVEAQIKLLKKIVPGAKKIALLYNSSEQNSAFQVAIAKKACGEIGLSYVDATVSNSNEIQQVVQNLVGKVDAIYVPTDNMIAAGITTVGMIAREAKLPVICGEEGPVMKGGLATYGINYYELGKLTGKQAVLILRDGKKPAEMPIEYVQSFDLTVNKDMAEAIGITIPSDL
ncbi:ABC transporter substrate-binding protein [Treponema sp. HNW]|uniref:ABC transporter substrate binding protein n=1 Tax=Treponema sp. HNW TaxID=3116654 RepID=UPI003D0C48D4